MKTINIAKDFGIEPYGRVPKHGKFNGERFRQEFLLPALMHNDMVVVEMRGTMGYGSSFLEESFGGLVRFGYFTEEELKKKLKVEHPLSSHVDRVWSYINQGQAKYGADKERRGEMEAGYPILKSS